MKLHPILFVTAMPPEQRKQIEQMMASRGIGMGAQGSVAKVWVTKEQAARKAKPQFREGCTQQVVRRSRNTMEMAGKWLAADCGDVKPRPVPAK